MQIPKDYPMVLTVAVAMNLHCWLQAWHTMPLRQKIFNKDFMRQHWGHIHKLQTGDSIMPQGYPDTGNGKYSQKLSYGDWYSFNVLQRNHQNYLQVIPIQTLLLLAAGLYLPKQSSLIGALFVVSRILYIRGYKSKHGASNKLRILGSILGTICLFANLGIVGFNVSKFFNNRGK